MPGKLPANHGGRLDFRLVRGMVASVGVGDSQADRVDEVHVATGRETPGTPAARVARAGFLSCGNERRRSAGSRRAKGTDVVTKASPSRPATTDHRLPVCWARGRGWRAGPEGKAWGCAAHGGGIRRWEMGRNATPSTPARPGQRSSRERRHGHAAAGDPQAMLHRHSVNGNILRRLLADGLSVQAVVDRSRPCMVQTDGPPRRGMDDRPHPHLGSCSETESHGNSSSVKSIGLPLFGPYDTMLGGAYVRRSNAFMECQGMQTETERTPSALHEGLKLASQNSETINKWWMRGRLWSF